MIRISFQWNEKMKRLMNFFIYETIRNNRFCVAEEKKRNVVHDYQDNEACNFPKEKERNVIVVDYK